MLTDTDKLKLQAEIADLVKWVVDHEGCVDHVSFISACRKIAGKATLAHGFRFPRAVQEQGLVTLDFACSLLGMFLPGQLMDYPRLPGHKALRDAE